MAYMEGLSAMTVQEKEENETQQNGFSTPAAAEENSSEAQHPLHQKPKLASSMSLDMTRPVGLHKAVLLYPWLQKH